MELPMVGIVILLDECEPNLSVIGQLGGLGAAG